MIDMTALKTAIRTRLRADATLMTLVQDVYTGRVPSLATWTLPVLEMGIQSDTEDPAAGYGGNAQDIVIRLMAYDKGPAVGVGDYDRCYAALRRAETVLMASRLTVSGMTVFDWRRAGGIPEAMPVDDGGYPRPQVGRMYRARIQE